MLNINFPDGAVRQYNSNVTGEEIASSISKTLAKSALAVAVDGVLQDLYLPINKSCSISIITGNDEAGLEIIRHDTAHLLAHAVKELYPDAQITIGPVIENGFYYDIYYKENFTPENLSIIEEKMREIEKRNEFIRREVWTRNEAKDFFEKIGEIYKSEIINSISENQEISLYRQGNFIDLCRGPHAPSTGKNKAFKLTKIAGAYWRGDSKNQMLQRIYGTAWANKQDLDNYLYQIEEAEKRDHRKIGRELDLFHIEDESPGMVFWHEKGWSIYMILENYIREKLAKNDYKEVKTPVFLNNSLWKKSGHWEKFLENMFISEAEEKIMALKPMSCPCHIQIFNHGLKSYRDLPLRMSEFGYCHRNEPSGSLHGLMRVRAFNQDDGHIFCSEEQITQETVIFCNLLKEIYQEIGFEDILIRFSDRPEKRAGRDELWDKAESSLKNAIDSTNLKYEINPGEGAFYGPKLEFVLKDALGRFWQCGTLQLDFVLPERLNANYIGKDGNKHHPVMLHRAILGTFERFIGILIEHYAGRLPFWLSPIQVVVAGITNEVDAYCQEVLSILKEKNIRTELDISADKINYKIRRHILQKIPYILVLGKREMETRTISVRTNAENENQKSLEIADFIKEIQLLNNSKGANHK